MLLLTMKTSQVQVEFNFLEALFKNSVQKSEASFDDNFSNFPQLFKRKQKNIIPIFKC